MFSASDLERRAARSREGRLWAAALVVCPLSYLAVALVRYSPAPGLLSACFVSAALIEVTVESRPRDRLRSVQAWAAGLGAAAAVIAAALWWGTLAVDVAALFALALLSQIGAAWALLPWLARDLTGGEAERSSSSLSSSGLGEEGARAALAFLLFLSLLVFGAGALWSRGEQWAPSPTGWALSLVAVTCGAMLREQLGSLERSARHGNLAVSEHTYRWWLVTAVGALVLAALLAAVLPWRTSRPQPATRTGTRTREQPAQSLPPRLERPAESLAAAAARAAVAGLPRPVAGIWLLALLLALLLATGWLLKRSRAARRILLVFAWLLDRAVRAWRRLRASLRRVGTPAAAGQAGQAPLPAWARDPFFDVLAHPEVLPLLTQREVILRTYHLFLTLAEALGQDRRVHQTPLEYAGSLEPSVTGAKEALRELTRDYLPAMYGGETVELPALSSLQATWRALAEALVRPFSPEEVALRKQLYVTRLATSPRPLAPARHS